MYQVKLKSGATIETDAPTEREARTAITKSVASTPGGVDLINWDTFAKPGAKPLTITPKAEKKHVHDRVHTQRQTPTDGNGRADG